MDLQQEIERLRKDAPNWKPEMAKEAAHVPEVRVGRVETDRDCSELLAVPISKLIPKAEELRGLSEDGRTIRDPFGGLCEEKPERVLSALRHKAERREFPVWAWRGFLDSGSRKADPIDFKKSISDAMANAVIPLLPPDVLDKLLRSVTGWFSVVAGNLATEAPRHYEKFLELLISKISECPEAGTPGGLKANGGVRDWVTEALNAPSGRIAEILARDPIESGQLKDNVYPKDSWLPRLEGMLALPEDSGRYASVFFASRLHSMFSVDPKWTETHLIDSFHVADGDPRDQDTVDAWWAGYLWGEGRYPPEAGLFKLIKRHLLKRVATERNVERYDRMTLAVVILGNWLGSASETGEERRITDEDFRKGLLKASDEFRLQVLRSLEEWARGSDEAGDPDEDRGYRKKRVLRFLEKVWPRQLFVKTPDDSDRLMRLAFAEPRNFAEISEAVLPLLVRIDKDHVVLSGLLERGKEGPEIVARHPERVLDLLHAALPAKASSWPRDFGATLDRIADARPALERDERLIELRRAWNSR